MSIPTIRTATLNGVATIEIARPEKKNALTLAMYEAMAEALRARFGAEHITIALPGEIRALSLEIFDRTFLITYLMEAVAVLIGLFGIATTFAALATTRQGEFGMLRHLGFTRGEIGRLIAVEGALTAGLGVLAGLLVAAACALGSGGLGTGRLAEVGARFPELLIFAPTILGLSGLTGGLAVGLVRREWPGRRREDDRPAPDPVDDATGDMI